MANAKKLDTEKKADSRLLVELEGKGRTARRRLGWKDAAAGFAERWLDLESS